jgi:hypothetical protein
MYEKNIDPLIRKACIYQKDNQKPKDRQRNGQKKWDIIEDNKLWPLWNIKREL